MQKLMPADGLTGDMFGSAVAITGATIAVGAPNHPANPATNADYYAGAVYVYERTGSGWAQSAKLTAPSGDANMFDAFGYSVAIDRSLLAIGAPQDDGASSNSNAGAVYVYLRSGSNWSLESKLTPPANDASSSFGRSVALWDDTLAVGSESTNTAGKAYVYRRLGVTWTLEATVTPSNNPLFGWSVALFQNTLAVGAPGSASNGIPQSGRAFLYERTSSGWSALQTLDNPSPDGFDQFGWSVALYGRQLAVGTPFDTIGGIGESGGTYIYAKTNGQYGPLQTVTSSPSVANQHFGNAVAMTNGKLICGAEIAYIEEGRAYRFVAPQASLWGQVAVHADPASADQPWFGCSVAVSDYTVIGARKDDEVALDAGAAFVFCAN